MIDDRYRTRTPRSAALYARASRVLPAGLTHDSRATSPYPIYAARAAGARKWDVDGNEYVDYFGGHGALLLGHAHPAVVEAIQSQVTQGTHWGSSHEAEVRWAELVQRLIPCAERVRFTASGTEASHLALRLARAFTGKSKVVRFIGHFHGWHDQVASGSLSHFDGSVPAGIPSAVVHQTVLLPADLAVVTETLKGRDDIAAVILEASGASWGMVPLPAGFLAGLRAATRESGVVLILDEVITGFRWSRGGAQARFDVVPDICVLAKIVAGGFRERKAERDSKMSHRLRVAMLANGVDIMGAPGGLVSAAHGAEDVARTLEAFRTSVRWLKAEGDIVNPAHLRDPPAHKASAG